jgi:DNA-binding MarR family transcriptional regulator
MLAVERHAARILPIKQSIIRLSVLASVVAEADNEDLSEKQLFAGLNFSSTGVRYHFDDLVKKGWLRLEVDSRDKRRKLVKPTQKLLTQFMLFTEACENAANENDAL